MEKYEKLLTFLKSKKSICVAFSGGVDSTFLAKASYDALKHKTIAVTVKTPFMKKSEIEYAKKMASKIGIKHKILELEFLEELKTNPLNRCYICKLEIFNTILKYAKDNGFLYVADGSNCNDLKEHRPGRLALEELEILTPLIKLGFYKSEIREYSKNLHLKNWNKPSTPCLLTRFPYNKKITNQDLKIVQKAEDYFCKKGYDDCRVRFDDLNARIELPNDKKIEFIKDICLQKMVEKLKKIGFNQITLDLQEYRHEAIDETKEILCKRMN